MTPKFTARTALLDASAFCDLRLATYPPDTKQGQHSHALPTVSLLLAGEARETVGAREARGQAAWLSVKPPDVRHGDVFGPDGAVILSVVVRDPELWRRIESPEWKWRALDSAACCDIVAQIGRPGDAASDTVFDLLALAARIEPAAGLAPLWLRRVEQRLRDEPDASLARIAADAGVHRVYLARSFRRWHGISPSLFRLRLKTSAALGRALFGGGAGAAAAQDSGFADQSHMTRSIRRFTGHTLSHLRAFAEGKVPCVQA